ncbi:MAG: ATP-binding cassette domain-containing protein [Muribaculaceae bacterium]|nr:ATP-binding cassette domain-containing protein [Muribaculaceae bacterium]
MDKILIKRILPEVFKGMEGSSRIRDSRIWDAAPFTFERGCRICLQAESGAGKSSLLSFIYGNRSDYSGDIFFDDKNIRKISIQEWCRIRKTEIALLPQDMRLFPEISVIENIRLKNNLTNCKTEREIMEMLELLGIADKKDVPVSLLSIGQQQRVAIVRTLCQPFDFIFLDEPVSHLDDTNNRIVSNLIENEAHKREAGVITTSVGNQLKLNNMENVNL